MSQQDKGVLSAVDEDILSIGNEFELLKKRVTAKANEPPEFNAFRIKKRDKYSVTSTDLTERMKRYSLLAPSRGLQASENFPLTSLVGYRLPWVDFSSQTAADFRLDAPSIGFIPSLIALE